MAVDNAEHDDATGDQTIDLGAPQSAESATSPGIKVYDPRVVQDTTRTYITIALLVITGLVIFLSFVMAAWALGPNNSFEENRKTIVALLNVIFGPVIALLGSVIGFYFGAGGASNQSKSQ